MIRNTYIITIRTHIYVYTCKYNTSNQQSTTFLTRAQLILIILFWCYCTLFRRVFMNMFIMYSIFFHDHPTPSYCKVVDYYYVQEYKSSEYINIRVYLLLLYMYTSVSVITFSQLCSDKLCKLNILFGMTVVVIIVTTVIITIIDKSRQWSNETSERKNKRIDYFTRKKDKFHHVCTRRVL